ncbi:MAG: oligosaccharide flippase family protein [Anaerorhabdus sp.]|uniref:oligosaccharide flippase family protein n=1 Tax=Anaerorhabdus sp. TaxID=1872524 RepID=UPI002FC9F631
MKNTIFKNAIFKSILNICNIFIPLIVGTYITRTLDIEIFGLYNSVQAQFEILLLLGGFGIYNYGVREISFAKNNKDLSEKLFTELFIIGILTNLFFGILLIIFTVIYTTGTERIIYMILSLQFVGNIISVEWINEANENYRIITIKTLLVRIIYIFAIFCFVKNSYDIVPYTVIMTIIYILNNLFSFIYVINTKSLNFKKISLKKHMKPLIIVFIFTNIGLLYSQVDKIMLGIYSSNVSVSIYQIPTYIVGIITSLTASIVVVSIPRLSHIHHNESIENYKVLLMKTINSYLFLLVPAIFGMIVLAREIILLYGGIEYIDCTIPLVCAALISIPNAYNYITGNLILFICGKEKQLTIINLCGGVFHIILNFLLLFFKIFNVTNVILCLGISYCFVSIISYIYIKYKLKFKPRIMYKSVILYFVASILFIPISLIIKSSIANLYLSVFITVISCFSLYAIIMAIFKENIFIMICQKLRLVK